MIQDKYSESDVSEGFGPSIRVSIYTYVYYNTYCHIRTTTSGNIMSSLPRIVTSAKHE